MNEENRFTRLSLDRSDLHLSWEVPHEDVTPEEMVEALHYIMVGMTFYDSAISNAMADYLENVVGWTVDRTDRDAEWREAYKNMFNYLPDENKC